MIGFSEWAAHHCTVFGLFDVRHAQMVASWQPLFDAAGYSASELEDASGWLAIHSPPKFPSEHLDALRRRLNDARAVQRRTDQAEADRGTCALCGGAGRVIVPHRSGVVHGQWRPVAGGTRPHYHTEAVSCSCPRGRFGHWTARDPRGGTMTMLTLAEYELDNPLWRRQMAARDRELAELCRLNEMSPEMRAVLDRVATRVRQPGDDDA